MRRKQTHIFIKIGVIFALLCTLFPLNVRSASSDENGEPIKIGANYELSGSAASYGQQMLEGLELAVAQVNHAGGLLGGRPIKIISYDNKSDITESASVAQRLVSQGVVGVVGPALTGTTQAQLPILEQAGIPSVSPSATDDAMPFDKNGNVLKYFFRVCFSNSYQGQIGARFVANELGAKRAVVLTDQAADYSQGLVDAFSEEFQQLGGEIVFDTAFQSGDTDYSAILTSLFGIDYDVIYLPAYYNEAGLFIKQARELGITQPIVGTDGYSSPVLLELTGPAAANDIYYTDHFSPESDDPAIQSFLSDYQIRFDKPAGTWQALGYDAARLIFDAIERAGSDDPAKITEALAATTDFRGVTGTFAIDANHNPVKPAIMIELQQGTIHSAKFVK